MATERNPHDEPKAASASKVSAAALVLAVALGAPHAAQAQDGSTSARLQPLAAPTPAAAKSALPKLGLTISAGVPDGAQVALVVRPADWARLYAGGGYNMISKGVAGGLSLLPFGVGPSLTVEGGHYFEGDANGIARKLAGTGYGNQAVLERVGYDYANAHLGLELGKRRLTFFIHGGLSYVRATIHNLNAQINGQTDVSSSGATVAFNQDPIVKAIGPSLKLGFILYLF